MDKLLKVFEMVVSRADFDSRDIVFIVLAVVVALIISVGKGSL